MRSVPYAEKAVYRTHCQVQLKRKMCFRHTWFDEPFCDRSLEDCRQVLEKIPKTVETIFFGGMGEPLFHKDI